MAELKDHFTDLGFTNVRTYIQSGNILFQYNESHSDKLAENIAIKINEQYGFDVPVFILTTEELKKAIKDNPFANDELREQDKLHITFLISEPEKENQAKFEEIDYRPEEYVLNNKLIYLYTPKGYGRAKLNNNYIENKLKVLATTRNWKTANKLIELADELINDKYIKD